jgi:hypothetical protein
VVVVVLLLLAGLLRLLLLRELLVLLLSGWAFLPTGGGRRRQSLLHSIEGHEGGGSGRQPLNSMLDFFQAEIIDHRSSFGMIGRGSPA